jgi:hypothetical protein
MRRRLRGYKQHKEQQGQGQQLQDCKQEQQQEGERKAASASAQQLQQQQADQTFSPGPAWVHKGANVWLCKEDGSRVAAKVVSAASPPLPHASSPSPCRYRKLPGLEEYARSVQEGGSQGQDEGGGP